jgi:hypothetical protein
MNLADLLKEYQETCEDRQDSLHWLDVTQYLIDGARLALLRCYIARARIREAGLRCDPKLVASLRAAV